MRLQVNLLDESESSINKLESKFSPLKYTIHEITYRPPVKNLGKRGLSIDSSVFNKITLKDISDKKDFLKFTREAPNQTERKSQFLPSLTRTKINDSAMSRNPSNAYTTLTKMMSTHNMMHARQSQSSIKLIDNPSQLDLDLSRNPSLKKISKTSLE